MAKKYMVETENVVEIAEVEMLFIEQCYNEWGWLDDTGVDLTEYITSHSDIDEVGAKACSKYFNEAIRKGLEQKGIIGFEEHRPESEGGDLYYITSEYEHLFTVA